jgi:hypothetical protein
MAGLEVVVRPVVFPGIRPRASRSLPPLDDPTKGMAVINGNPAGSIGNSYSWSASSSYSRPTETERRVDEVRVYQMEDDGTIKKENFVDMEVANRITMNEGGESEGGVFVPGGSKGSKGNSLEIAHYYARQIEKANIEIKKRDVIKKNQEQAED